MFPPASTSRSSSDMAAILGKKLGMTQVFTDDGDRVVVTVIEAGPCAVTQVKTNARDGYQAVQMGFGDMKKNKVNSPQAGHFKKAGVDARRHLAEIRVEAETAEGASEEEAILKLVVPAIAEVAVEEPEAEEAEEPEAAAKEAAAEESAEAGAGEAKAEDAGADAAKETSAGGEETAEAEAPKAEEKKSAKKGKKKAKARAKKPEITVAAFKAGQKVKVTGISKGKGFAGVIKRHNFAGGPASHGAHFHRAPGSVGASAYPSRVFKGIKLPGQMGNKKSTQLGLTVFDIDTEKNLMFVKGAVPGSKNGIVFIQTQ
ncbi:MAG: 50S ribosomal protein L3 [Thermoleophilia bacterium]